MAGDSKDQAAGDAGKDQKPHKFFTFERTIEIAKLLATIWIAFVGSFVTMQFNERQHELSRMEAIAKMLPHVSAGDDKPSSSDDDAASAPAIGATKSGGKPEAPILGKSDMGRDGAIWAIFRTANNRIMLRDLASLFPEDIYRVVSSIAVAGGLEHDTDAITALQVASEKLAAKYSNDPNHAEMATRLYNQAVRLKERKPTDTSPLTIVDLTTEEVAALPSQDQAAALITSLNRLAELHLQDAQNNTGHHVSTGHWQAKQMFKRARQLGIGSPDKLVQAQVAKADEQLGAIYLEEKHPNDALTYLKEARAIQVPLVGEKSGDVQRIDALMAQASSAANGN